MYVITLLVVLLLSGIGIAYAYISALDQSKKSAVAVVGGKTACIDVSLDAVNENKLDTLTYNYPITDAYASSNVKPVEITVTNKCTDDAVDYALALTTLSSTDDNYITNDKIRFSIKKQIGSESEKEFKKSNYLSNMVVLDSGVTYNLLNTNLSQNTLTKDFTNKVTNILDKQVVEPNSEIKYKVYMWIDYYEGDQNVYYGEVHNPSYDNTTKGKTYNGIFSLVVNGGGDIITDLSGNGNAGVIHNIAKWDRNEGITTSDENIKGYIDCGLANLDLKNGLSLVIKLKFNSYNDKGSSAIFGNWYNGGGGIYLWVGTSEWTSNMFFNPNGFYEGADNKFNLPPNLNTYYIAILTFNHNNLNIYIDGEKISNYIADDFKTVVNSKGSFLIGRTALGLGGELETAYITVTDALIFDRALSDKEIESNYKNTINPVNKDNLLLQYKFTD